MKKQQMKDMIRKMYAARVFEERVNEMFMKGMIHGTTHLSVGQEGVAVGAIYGIAEDDLMMSNHRGHSHCIAKNADVKRMMCELLGRRDGFCKGMGGSMHIVDIASNNYGANGIIGPSIAIATGIALAVKKDKSNKVVLDFFGDGTSNTGNFHESLNIAALWKLPIIYVCENNLYGMSTSVEKTVSVPDIATRALAYGIPGIIVDGNDALAVMKVVSEAAERARKGDGPTLIEAKTYRWLGHSKSDKRAYRTKDEEAAWKARCPIKHFENYILQNGITQGEIDEIKKDVEQNMEDAVNYAIAADVMSIEEAQALVYA